MNNCKPFKCPAERFRLDYPNYSFSTIGYSTSPQELNNKYLEEVCIDLEESYVGKKEVHRCKSCNNIVYEKIHR